MVSIPRYTATPRMAVIPSKNTKGAKGSLSIGSFLEFVI